MTIQINNKAICNALAEQMMSANSQLKKLENIYYQAISRREVSLPFDFCKGKVMKPLNKIPQQIGIWTPVFENGQLKYYQRNKELAMRFGGNNASWSETETLHRVRPHTKTIVYLGESVARGFVYDPVVTPAGLLQEKLKPAGDYEIIDLACTGINASALLQTAQEALELHPDMLVIHAGNNWWNAWWGNPSELVTQSLIGLNVQEIQAVITEQLSVYIRFLLESLINLCRLTEVKLFFVLPEFNYSGWQNEFAIPGWLNDKSITHWLEHAHSANEYLQKSDFVRARASCIVALELDNETSPLTLELMAKAESGLGNELAAKEYYVKSKDAVIWQFTTHTPRCPSFIEALIREVVGHSTEATLIDLPALFYQKTGTVIPDKTLFVDYVHHSLKGMDWVSDALASAITDSNVSVNLADLYEDSCAGSHLLVALHNANYSQPDDSVMYWLDKVLSTSGANSALKADIHFLTQQYSSEQKIEKKTYRSDNAAISKFIRAFSTSTHSGVQLRNLLNRHDTKWQNATETSSHYPDGHNLVINTRNQHIYRHYPARHAVFSSLVYENKLVMNEVNPESRFYISSLVAGEYKVTVCARSTSSDNKQGFSIRINGDYTLCNLSTKWENFTFTVNVKENLDITICWPRVSGSQDYHQQLFIRNMIVGDRSLPLMRITGIIGQIIIIQN
ncbi:hypothetical protein [Photorhabdus bodei]|uniref:SGNH hydrolase-type esterase domain-containing protein n=1 Tax=Photorhabdus bodei TaxID=2029681 RepID=A0A329XD30_9GAMM|nr:hypothetical protein [Photorhabdus bodei]NDL00805.1 hypothetical protein [Photorhabdus bodei]NDL04971.1 hypothetical protein [Photorhabdus bodei]NDL09304.1 hypothetical protein [Photorhabdus bodei]RAX13582.1 hypothetical protein CKY02_05545 [Photorhabdus bodei]